MKKMTLMALVALMVACTTVKQPTTTAEEDPNRQDTCTIYDLRLANVLAPGETGEANLTEFTYEDQNVSLVVLPARGSFNMTLENKGDRTVRLLWDRMAFVSPLGTSTTVVSGERSWMERNSPQPPEPIPGKARAVASAVPKDHLDRLPRGQVVIKEFQVRGQDRARHEELVSQLTEGQARLIVPLEVNDEVEEYTFVFDAVVSEEQDGLACLGVYI